MFFTLQRKAMDNVNNNADTIASVPENTIDYRQYWPLLRKNMSVMTGILSFSTIFLMNIRRLN